MHYHCTLLATSSCFIPLFLLPSVGCGGMERLVPPPFSSPRCLSSSKHGTVEPVSTAVEPMELGTCAFVMRGHFLYVFGVCFGHRMLREEGDLRFGFLFCHLGFVVRMILLPYAGHFFCPLPFIHS